MKFRRLLLAATCVFLALIANEWTLERFVLADGELESPRLQPLHLPRDGHLSAAGHRWVADAILGWLRRTGPIPSASGKHEARGR